MEQRLQKQNKTNRAGKGLVINQVIVKAPQRKVLDVGDWRSAMKSAENGRPARLYDLFEDIIIDGVLGDAIQKRIDAVTNSELTFQTHDGTVSEEINNLIDTMAFEDLLTEIIRTKIYGRSAIEFEFHETMRIHPIPPKHINLTKKQILLNQSDEQGIPYEGDPFILVLGKERDFGLLLKAAPLAIYKRGGFGDWSQWIELFGMPRRIGKYNVYDPESRKVLEEALSQAGSASYVVTPKETDIETEQTSANSGTSYDEFRKACNEEILITVLGQTMTTVQGDRGARSLGEVHKEVEASKNRADLRFVQRVLNEKVLPLLEARGFPVSGGKFVFPEAAEPLTVSDIVQLSDIMPIPQSYLHDKYSIPAPKDGEPIARRVQTYDTQDEEESITNSDNALGNAEQGFLHRMMRFFGFAPTQIGAYDGKARITLSDNAGFDTRLIQRIAQGKSYFDAELFEYLSNDLLNAVRTTYERSIRNADVSYDYNAHDDAFLTAMEMNLFHFSAAKTLAEIQELNKLFRQSKNFADFTDKAAVVCTQFNKTWQKTEYETAVLTAEAASTYHRLKAKKYLYPYWMYETAGDDRVREEHRLLRGIILPVDDIRWNKIYPPNGWKCRCYVVPKMSHEVNLTEVTQSKKIVDDFLGSPEWAALSAQGWDVNRAENAEVFNKNQMYIRKFPDKAAALLGKLYYNDYGLDSFGKKMAAATLPAPQYEGMAKDWYAAHKQIEDYNGRKVAMNEIVFTRHTTKKYEKTRVPLLECIPDVLKNPDEVWINDYIGKFNDINFIKFYEGKCIVVVCEIANGNVYQIKTWFEIHGQAATKEKTKTSRAIDPRWRYRRGLLIKKG